MKDCPFSGDARLRTATCPGTWLTAVHLWRPAATDQLVTGPVETAAILLSGTFDLFGGPTAWPARGARQEPFTGRPMAVFLPPQTAFRAERGQGEILLVTARQPERPAAEGRTALASRPLLPLAGSGKAFDPVAGDWKPAETFPTAPESLPPRRMERIPVGPLTVERVLAPDYKAATLSVDEVVLPAGSTLRLADVPGLPPASELLVFSRSEGRTELTAGNLTTAVTGDAVHLLPAAAVGSFAATATVGRAYLVFAYAGKG